MAKHKRVWNQAIHEKYVREGRGSGCGPDYKPWIRVQDFASRGVVSRVKGRTTGRVHHLMSNNELAYFYILDWSENVTDIREQYPLSDLESAIGIAAQAGVRYPKDNTSGYPYIMTCDFMISTTSGPKARTIKMSSELSNKRVLEKLEIERRYWSKLSVDWKIVTENEILFRKAKNVEWLYSARELHMTNTLQDAAAELLQIINTTRISVSESAELIESYYYLKPGAGLQLFKYLVLNGFLKIDLNEPINLNAKGLVEANEQSVCKYASKNY